MTSSIPSRSGARVVRVLHSCLETHPGAVPLAEARLIDRRRLAVVLQAAGLLSVLERAGWRIPDWGAAQALPDGRLMVPGAEPGRSRRAAQEVLLELLDRLFGLEEGRRLPGKGLTRLAVRSLTESWRQSLVPLSPDDAAGQILDAAPFLWERGDAEARGALAGELTVAEGGRMRAVLWVAGPPAFRRRLLAGPPGLMALRSRLAGEEARGFWEGAEEGDPRELTAARRWRAAAAAWSRHPPRNDEDRVAFARSLAALGRFETALAALSGLSSTAARILRADCQVWLGQLGAALATLDGLRQADLTPEESVDLAEIASRVHANRGGTRRVRPWRSLLAAAEEGGPRTVLRARLAAALIAWDERDLEAMARALADAEPAAVYPNPNPNPDPDPDLAWRWHHARAHLAMGRDGDGAAAIEHAARALRLARRRLPRHRAAGLWNDLGLARALAGDLAGAERAFRHSHRLMSGCDGPRKVTLALFNLAEIRLRQGRLEGVREILDRSTAENRAAGNLRGLTQDAELQARWELVAGRPEAALALCRTTLADLDRQKIDWRREVLLLLAGRALGWLERTAEAAAALEGLPAAVLGELEPEERPAVRALAGQRDEARREAAALPPGLRALWEAVLGGEGAATAGVPPISLWEPAFAGLEPWRAARLTFDVERAAPGAAPVELLRSAAARLRECGSLTLAETLEARDQGPWQALTAYCSRMPGDPTALAALFAGAGYPEAAVLLVDNTSEQIVLAGPGGGEETVHPLPGGGRLTLRARRTDLVVRALLALAARDLAAPPVYSLPVVSMGRPAPRATGGTGGGMAGDSTDLRAALGRLDLLAAGDVPILILGESGTGKELAARRAHRTSPRSRAPFLAVNCAALSENLILSDLFGHAKGAFTGADRDRAGVFQAASGGTVFLDEIGDLPLSAQAMLLRVIQEGEVRRLGESEPRKVDVRILAATHRNLAAMVQAKTFRQDLYYRLKVGLVELPPLRDRGGDVLLLAEIFLSRLGRSPVPHLSKEARARLLSYSWPGNVRELENVLRVAATLAGNDPIRPEHLDLPAVEKPSATFYHHAVEAARRQEVESALTACDGNRTRAAQRLGMSRQGLSYLMRQLGIT